MTIQQRETLNFMVPAQGGTQVLGFTLPGDLTPSGYTVDFRSLNLIIQGTLFIPQACTIDLSQQVAPLTVTFRIPSIGYEAVIYAGTTKTFQFPALEDLLVTFTPSSGNPSFNCFWYNYPALPDVIGQISANTNVQISTLPPAPLAGSASWKTANGNATAAGSTAIYAPTSQFFLNHLDLYLDPKSTVAAAGTVLVEILDGATVIAAYPVYVPAAAAPLAGALFIGRLDFPSNSYLSLIAGNSLDINLSVALTAGGVRYNAVVNG